MRVRSVDQDNDWNFGKGKQDYRKDQDCLAQNIKCRLQMFLGDCFFALDNGIDWFNLLGSFQIIQLQMSISALIINTEGVIEITSIDFINDEKRNFTIVYSVNTIFGEIQNQTVSIQ